MLNQFTIMFLDELFVKKMFYFMKNSFIFILMILLSSCNQIKELQTDLDKPPCYFEK